MRTLSKALGITLTEMLIAILIIVIITLISIPSITNLLNNHRLDATAETLYYNLQYARTEALKRNALVYVSFTTGDNWCYGLNAGASCDCTTAGSCGLGAVAPTSSGQITLTQSGYGSGYISFEGSHGAANNNGSLTMTLTGGSSLITLTIGKLGDIQMCSTDISGYNPC
ncbi:MAG: GspH/FimT family protein [Gammaproteobacteria bacterium]